MNSSRLIVLTLALCILTGIWGYCHECSREPDDTGDESAYLSESAWIAEHGGIFGYLRLCAQGRYQRTGTYPLLAVAAAPFASRDLAFIRPARLFKSALTALALIGIFLVTGRLTSWDHGAWLIAMIALSRNWLGKAGVFTIDPIIYALIFLAWLLIAGLWRPKGRWLWAGAAFGLAWMAKGTALLLLAGLIGAVAWRLAFGRDRLRLLTSARFWMAGVLFAAGMAVTAAPLLMQTTLAARSESALTRYLPPGLWLDSWSQRLETNPERATQGMSGYLQRHGLAGAAERLVQGMADQAPRFVGVFAIDKEAPKALWVLTLICSAGLFALAVRGMVRERDSWARSYTVLFVLAGFLLYSWFSAITYASRFAATFGPVFAWYAAAEISPLLRRLAERLWAARPELREAVPRRVVAGIIALLILCLVISNGKRLPADPREPLPLKPDYAKLMNWYDQNVARTGAVCVHTMDLGWRFRFLWLLPPSQAIEMPMAPDFAAFMAWADKAEAEYLLLARPAPEYADFLKPPLGDFICNDPAAGLIQSAPIPGWRLVLEDRDGVCDYLVYRRQRTR
ncbi:MAG: hypothetical protein ABSA67_13305 [Candidatus Brocadiia bacterium]|jgi:hypothetical protein